ncbi:MAG: ACP S-malonyltransferase [Deltaproteobacteria bacterium]|nr:ACP S-malonyltransferase [Deltaproteobacteria bacterium]
MHGRTAFLFPGQGSQFVGMRAGLGSLQPAQRKLFEQAEALLGLPLHRLIDEGPEAELTRTSNAQPALLVMDLAHAEGARAAGRVADVVLGHSLGEYAALVWAGTLALDDALRLARARGRLMEEAVERTPGRMVAVLKVPTDRLEAVLAECRTHGVLEIANYNAPGQLVLSGETRAVERAVERLRSERLGRTTPLNVAAPFHCSLMTPAAEAFRKTLLDVELRPPQPVFIDNVTGRPEDDPERIRRKLVQQMVQPVRWETAVRSALELGVDRFLECGPRAVLSGLVRRIAPPRTTIERSETLLVTSTAEAREPR